MKRLYDSLVINKVHNKAIGFMNSYYPKEGPKNKPNQPMAFEKAMSSIAYNPKFLHLRTPTKINHEGTK